jgi:hypothetical protein
MFGVCFCSLVLCLSAFIWRRARACLAAAGYWLADLETSWKGLPYGGRNRCAITAAERKHFAARDRRPARRGAVLLFTNADENALAPRNCRQPGLPVLLLLLLLMMMMMMMLLLLSLLSRW